MADVFVSYSRRDQDFVRRLHEALVAAGREVWVDWEGIPTSAKWMDEVRAAIDAADAFVFVVSPDSAASPVCRDEAEHALEVGKRIVPVVWRDTPEGDLPAAISAHNWLTLREGDDFEAGFARLLAALDTDLEWVKEHTRLVTRAREWEASGKERSRLLRGRDLGRAEQAIARVDRDPRPTPLQTSYVLASRAAERRGARIRTAVLSGGLVVALVLAGFAILQRNTAEQNATLADQQRQVAEEQRAEAESARKEAEERRVTALGRQLVAQSLADRPDQPISTLLAIEAVRRTGSQEAWANLTDVLDWAPVVVRYLPPDGWVHELSASADGERLAVITRPQESGAEGLEPGVEVGHLTVYSVGDWSVIEGPIPATDLRQDPSGGPDTSDLAFSPDGTKVAFPSLDGLAVLDLDSGHVWTVPRTSGRVTIDSLAWRATDSHLLWIDHDPGDAGAQWINAIGIGDPAATSTALRPGQPWVPNAALSPDGRWAVVAGLTSGNSDEGVVVAFDARTGARVSGVGSEPRGDALVGFAPDGSSFVTLQQVVPDEGPGIELLQPMTLPDLETAGSAVPTQTKSSGIVWAEADPDLSRVHVWSAGQTVDPYGNVLASIDGMNGHVVAGAATLAGPRFIGRARSIDMVDPNGGVSRFVQRDGRQLLDGLFDPPVFGVTTPGISGDGSTLAVAPATDQIRFIHLIDLASGAHVREVRPSDPSGIAAFGLTSDGAALYSLHQSGQLLRTEAAGGPGRVVGRYKANDGFGEALIVGPNDAVALLDFRGVTLLSPDGSERTLWTGDLEAADFMPDGSAVIVGDCEAGVARVLDEASGTERSSVDIGGCASAVDVDSTGTRLLVNVRQEPDGSVLKVFDLPSGVPLGVVQAHGGIARLEDGTPTRTAVTLLGEVKRWDLEPDHWLQMACDVAGRNLTSAEWSHFVEGEPYRATCDGYPASP